MDVDDACWQWLAGVCILWHLLELWRVFEELLVTPLLVTIKAVYLIIAYAEVFARLGKVVFLHVVQHIKLYVLAEPPGTPLARDTVGAVGPIVF